MADESDLERTEPASPRRREQAREEGQVPRSPELSTFAVVLAGAAGLWLMGGALFRDLAVLVRSGMRITRDNAFHQVELLTRLHGQVLDALVALLPLGAALFLAALLAPLLFSGWLFSPKALLPDLERLDPLQGLQRMFSAKSLIDLGKAILKTALIAGMAIWVVWLQKDGLLRLTSLPPGAAMLETGRLVGFTFLAMVGAMLVITAVDVPYQMWSFNRKLRMTREEIRNEAKETEGDPRTKARIRSLQRDAARRRMMAAVPKADVVVTNPSHYAVALRYREGSMRAPEVVAKGMNLIAARIRELADEHRIPVLEAPPLARALYRHSELDREIPEALYTAVAEVLAYVYQLRRARTAGGPDPVAPLELVVPPELDPGPGAP